MHPVFILIPTLALVIGPRLWVKRVLSRHHRDDEDLPGTGAEVAREFLDRNGLQRVKVEVTDLGDHYDPEARAVRLARDKYGRKTLTAATTAAHEVGHAMQHAADFGPFVWRTRLIKVARVTGEIGAPLLLAVPIAAIVTRNPIPPAIIGSAALAILGTGVIAQLAALPTELDASFRRALPMLKDGQIRAEQVGDAHQILTACSLTYVASSLAAVLHVWPWLPRGPMAVADPARPRMAVCSVTTSENTLSRDRRRERSASPRPVLRRNRLGGAEALIRPIAKPLIRSWLRFSR